MIHHTSRTIVALAVAVVAAAGGGASAESNDSFSNAAYVEALPFQQEVMPSSTTVEPGEPAPSCSLVAGSVWYRVELELPATVSIAQRATSTGTFIAVWQGEDTTALTEVACDDDAFGTRLAHVSFIAQPGTVYHVQVGPTIGSWDGTSDPLRVVLSEGIAFDVAGDRDGAEAGSSWSEEDLRVSGDVSVDRIEIDADAEVKPAGGARADACAAAWHARACVPSP